MASGELIVDGKISDANLQHKLRSYKHFKHFHYGGTSYIQLFYKKKKKSEPIDQN